MHTSKLLSLSAVALLLVSCSTKSSPPPAKPSAQRPPEHARSKKSSSKHASVATAPDAMVSSPKPGSKVLSPLTVTGLAKGGWFFEGQFPFKLVDAKGKEIAFGFATAKGEWQQDKLVPFEGTLTFTTKAASGTLILKNSNPSSLPQFDKSISIPVQF